MLFRVNGRTFTDDTELWLRNSGTGSVTETADSAMKRVAPIPLRKRPIQRLASEIPARICVLNLKQLAYLKYTYNIHLDFTNA